jgi:mRNA interferase RelE/StbE
LDIILSKEAEKFISNLQSKYARQIAFKIQELHINEGNAQDSKLLKGSKEKYYRVDVGEFRIIYQIKANEIRIFLIGKRNDDEIYKLFMRKAK